MNRWWGAFTRRMSAWTGSQWGFILGLLAIIGWLVVGPLLGFSNTWLLSMMAGAGILSFLVVFLIQSSHNRDIAALHLKLNEIIHVVEPAHNGLIAAENLTYEELCTLVDVYRRLAREGRPGGEKASLLAAVLEEGGVCDPPPTSRLRRHGTAAD